VTKPLVIVSVTRSSYKEYPRDLMRPVADGNKRE
jgi:hypothetical protein